MKKEATCVLLTAYAVNPYKGSEDGTGWNIIFELSKKQKLMAITRQNNQAAIEQYLVEQGIESQGRLNFAYFDLPYWMRWWKKGERGALLYFYLWQIGVVFFIWRRGFKFDLVHHLNFHSDWMPSFLWLLGKPFLWGPIGHHPAIPKAYLKTQANTKAYYLDRLKSFAKRLFWHFDPFLKITQWKAKRIFTINSSVQKVLGFASAKEIRLPAVANRKPSYKTKSFATASFRVLSIGRFVDLKAFDLVIRAFAHFYHQQSPADQAQLELYLIGKGPSLAKLQKLTRDLKLGQVVNFQSWMPRAALDQYFERADLFFFASHEGAGMVVPEALSFGVPILCFDNIGPGEMIDESCGRKVPYSNPRESTEAFSAYLNQIYKNRALRKHLAKGARRQYETYFTWERKAVIIKAAYEELLSKKQSAKNKLRTKLNYPMMPQSD